MAKGKGGFLGQDGLNAPDQATGVTATAGDTQATVSFTAPSDVGGSAITGYHVQSNNGDGTYYLSYLANASYDSLNFSVSSQDGTPIALFFKPTGDALYVLGYSNDTVYQYSLSTAWDISTASYDSKSFSVGSEDTGPYQIYLKPDGTKMYMIGVGNDSVYQYSLSTAWDVSTASYDSKSFSVASQETGPTGLFFKDDGTKMYASGQANDAVYQYTLSTAWDVSTASYDSVSYSYTAAETGNRSIAFVNDGYSLFAVGADTDSIYEHTLTTAWDLSTAYYSGNSFSVSSQDTNPAGLFFKDDVSKMYMVGLTTDTIYQYSTNQADYPTSSPVTITGLTNGTSYTFNVWAINAFGWSVASDTSNSVSPYSPIAVFNMYTVAEYVNIATTGNTSSWGTTQGSNYRSGAVSSSTRGIIAGGGGSANHIEYVAMPTGGSFSDFGDLLFNANYYPAGSGNSTRGCFAYGTSSARNDIQYITIASTGNATDFGDTPATRSYAASMGSNSTRGLWCGGYNSSFSVQSTIYYVTIATTGNASTFGNLTQSRAELTGASNSTRGFAAGGYSGSFRDTIDYVTIASTGSATDFGDLTATTNGGCATAGSTRGLIGSVGGTGGSGSDVINYITLATTGNALDFGDLWQSFTQGVAFSNDHGGLS